jgi:hypothetical protein
MTLTKPRVPITSFDLCDKCGAPAMVRATLGSGPLYFCGHHARQAGTSLVSKAIEVYDPQGCFNYGKQSL